MEMLDQELCAFVNAEELISSVPPALDAAQDAAGVPRCAERQDPTCGPAGASERLWGRLGADWAFEPVPGGIPCTGAVPAETALWECRWGRQRSQPYLRDVQGVRGHCDAVAMSGGSGEGTGPLTDAAAEASGSGSGGTVAQANPALGLAHVADTLGATAGPAEPPGRPSPMAIDPPPALEQAGAGAVTPGAPSPSAADLGPGAAAARPVRKAGTGGKGKAKGKGNGLMDLDLPDLDSEPDLSEPEPEPEPEVEEEEVEEAEEEAAAAAPAIVPEAPTQPVAAAAATSGAAAPGGPAVHSQLAWCASNADGAESGGGGGDDTSAFADAGGSELLGSASAAPDAEQSEGDTAPESSSDEDDSSGRLGATAAGARLLAPLQHRRPRKPNRSAPPPAGTSAAAASAAAGAAAPKNPVAPKASGAEAGASVAAEGAAADLDSPTGWTDDEDYIYKDVHPNDLDIGIEFPKTMEFKPEDLMLPPDDDLDEGDEIVIGEDGKPVRKVRLSAAALAEGEAFIGLEGLVSWGRDGNFRGTITRFDPQRAKFMWLMLYEDGDEEWGAVTEDRNGWRVHGGLRPVSWLIQPPPPTDPLNVAAAAADAVPAPVPVQQRQQAAPPPSPGYIPNLMSSEIEVAVGRDGQTRLGTIVDFDPNRPRYKWFIRYIGYAEPAYGGTGEWGCLDEEKTTWLTHGYKRPVLSVTGGVGGMLAVAPTKPGGGGGAGGGAAAGGAAGFTPRKGPFGRTSLGLMYLMAASEPAPDGKFRLPVMALGAVRGAYGSTAGMAAAAGNKVPAATAGLPAPPSKPERVSSQALAGVPDEYGATLVGAKITITVGRGQGHKRNGTITEYDANRPKYRWRLTFDAVGEPAHGGAAEWGMLSDDQSLWLAHGYKRNITALSGVPERKPRPVQPPPQPPPRLPAPSPSPTPLSIFGSGGFGRVLPSPSPAPGSTPAPGAAAVSDAMDVDGAGVGSPETGGGDDGARSPTEGLETSPPPGEGDEAAEKAGAGESEEDKIEAALAAAAEAAVAIMYGGNTEVAVGLGIDISELNLGGDGEELGTNLVGARLLVAVGRAGARRSGVITDYEPNRPRYKWRLVYDAEVLPVGAPPPGAAATTGTADGSTAANAPAADGAAADKAPTGGDADAKAAADPSASAKPTADGTSAPAAAAATGAAALKAPAAADPPATAPRDASPPAAAVVPGAVVEGEWGTLSDDRTAWLCHGYRRAILASEGVPALPASYFAAAAAAAAAIAATSPSRKRRPNIIDEQSVASALLTLGKRARREAKAAAAAAREARQAEIAAAGGHVILVQPATAGAAPVVVAVGEGGVKLPVNVAAAAAAANGDVAGAGAAAGAAGTAAGDGASDGPLTKRVKLEGGEAGGEVRAVTGVAYVRQPVVTLGQAQAAGDGGAAGAAAGATAAAGTAAAGAAAAAATSNTGPVSPIANPEGVVGLEIDVDREPDGRQRGRVLSYDAKKPRLRWLIRYQDGNQEWGTIADDLTTLRVYGAVRPILWTSRPPAVLPKSSKHRSRPSGAAVRASPAASGAAAPAPAAAGPPAAMAVALVGAGATAPAAAATATATTAGAPGNDLSPPPPGGAPGNGSASAAAGAAAGGSAGRRSSENGDSDWVGGSGSGYGSAGTDYRYIFRRNGMCRAQITHQGCAIISPYYDTPEAAAAAADYYNYKLRGTAAHLNLGLTPEQRAVLDHLSLEQLQLFIKGRGDVHDLTKALVQVGGASGLQLYQQLQQLAALQKQQQELLLQQHQQQFQELDPEQQQLYLQQYAAYAQQLQQQQLQQQQQQQQELQQLQQQDYGDSRAASVDPREDVPPGPAGEGLHGAAEGVEAMDRAECGQAAGVVGGSLNADDAADEAGPPLGSEMLAGPAVAEGPLPGGLGLGDMEMVDTNAHANVGPGVEDGAGVAGGPQGYVGEFA